MRRGITVLHADSITKEKENGKRKRSLGCARDDETGEVHLTFFFTPLGKPTSGAPRNLLPEEEECRFPRIVISSESEKSFSFAVRRDCEGSGERETPYFMRLGEYGVSCRRLYEGKRKRGTKKIPRLRSG